MSETTLMTAAGHSVNGLRRMIDLDVEASNELQAEINQLRQDIRSGRVWPETEEKIAVMESSNKDMTRGVVRRIERMEQQGQRLTSTDREMLRALNAQLAVCDRQAMKLAELRDLTRERPQSPPLACQIPGGTETQELHLPLGGQPKRSSISPGPRATDHLRTPQGDARSTSPGPILDGERVDSKTGSPSRMLPTPKTTSPADRRSSSVVADSTWRRPPTSPYSPVSTGHTLRRSAEQDCPMEAAEKVPYEFWYNKDSVQGEAPLRRSGTQTDQCEYPPRRTQRTPPSAVSSTESPRGSTDGRRPMSRGNTLHRPLSNSPQTMPAAPGRVPSVLKDLASSRGSTDTPRSSLGDLPYEQYEDAGNLDGGVYFGPEKSSWPLLYRILDVDPVTPSILFEQMATRALARLSIKHDPARCPNDPEAPVRWAAVTSAYNTLLDPERRRLYDLHHQERKEFDDFDLAMLSVSDKH